MKIVRSESTVLPIEIDTISSATGVSVRENIVAEERTNQDGTSYTMFVYDETQYTNEEWGIIRLGSVETTMDKVVNALVELTGVTL